MELILIDSGLQNKAGHNYALAKTVSEALARRRLRCQLRPGYHLQRRRQYEDLPLPR